MNTERVINGIEILDVNWISTKDGCIGIILVNNRYENKVYIKEVAGLNEELDIQNILQWGSKFPVSVASKIINHLIKEE